MGQEGGCFQGFTDCTHETVAPHLSALVVHDCSGEVAAAGIVKLDSRESARDGRVGQPGATGTESRRTRRQQSPGCFTASCDAPRSLRWSDFCVTQPPLGDTALHARNRCSGAGSCRNVAQLHSNPDGISLRLNQRFELRQDRWLFARARYQVDGAAGQRPSSQPAVLGIAITGMGLPGRMDEG